MKRGVDYIGVSVGVMIFDDPIRLFLSKRSKNASSEKGHWETPGGSVDFGESLEAAVRREIMEEYGAEIDIVEQWPAEDHIIPDENQHWVATTFLARFKHGQQTKIIEADKCAEIGWFELQNLPSPLSIITQLDLERYQSLKS